jgi:hypothetical protein
MTFRSHMETMAARALAEFPQDVVPEIYVVTFRIDSVDQDCRFPYLAIGYNTESAVAKEAESAVDAWEARWNYAYFAPSGLEGVLIAGHDPVNDPQGAALHRQEAEERGLWSEDDVPEEQQEQLCREFHSLCVDLACRLHADGTIVETLGRPVPIVLYDMFAPGEEFALTKAANPPELVEGYLSVLDEGELNAADG